MITKLRRIFEKCDDFSVSLSKSKGQCYLDFLLTLDGKLYGLRTDFVDWNGISEKSILEAFEEQVNSAERRVVVGACT